MCSACLHAYCIAVHLSVQGAAEMCKLLPGQTNGLYAGHKGKAMTGLGIMATDLSS